MRKDGNDYTLFVFLFIYTFVVIKSECPEEWVEQNSRCYYLSIGQRPDTSWADAQSHCGRMGSNLVTINAAGENTYLLTQFDAEDMVWIGLNATEGINSWKWVDGAPLSYMNWGTGEPNGRDARDRCVRLVGGNGYWFDEDCSQNRSYVCEMDNGKHICEYTKDVIECYEDKVIFIRYASYGRLDTSEHCNFKSSVEGCHSNESLSVVANLCNKRFNCTLNARNRFYGDPCVNKVKYLNVVYSCVNPNVSVSSTTSAVYAVTSPRDVAATTVEDIESTNASNTADVTSTDSSFGYLAFTTDSPVSDAINGSSFTIEIDLATTNDMDKLGIGQTTNQGDGTVSSYHATTIQDFDETTVSRTDVVNIGTTQLGSTGIMTDYETGTVEGLDQSTQFETVTTAILDATPYRDSGTVENVYETTEYDPTTPDGIDITTDTNENIYGTTQIDETSVADFSIGNDLGNVTDIEQSTQFDLATTHTYDVTTYPDAITVKYEYGTTRLDGVIADDINETTDTNDDTYVTTVLDTAEVTNSSTEYDLGTVNVIEQSSQGDVSATEMFDVTTYHSTMVESVYGATQYDTATDDGNKTRLTTDIDIYIYGTTALDTNAVINYSTYYDLGTVDSIDQSTQVDLATNEIFDVTTNPSTMVERVYGTTQYDVATDDDDTMDRPTTDIDKYNYGTTALDTTAVINSSAYYDSGSVDSIDQSTQVDLATTEIFDVTTNPSTMVERVYGTTRYDLATDDGNEIPTDTNKGIYGTTELNATAVINSSTDYDFSTGNNVANGTQVDVTTNEIIDVTTYPDSSTVDNMYGSTQYDLSTISVIDITTAIETNIFETTEFEIDTTEVSDKTMDIETSTGTLIDGTTMSEFTTTDKLNYATQKTPTPDSIGVGSNTDRVGIFETERTTDSVTTESSLMSSVSTRKVTTIVSSTSTENLRSTTALQTTIVPVLITEMSSTFDTSLPVTATVTSAGQLDTSPSVSVTDANDVNTTAPSISFTTPLKSSEAPESTLTSLGSTVSSMTSDRSDTTQLTDQFSSVPVAVTSLQPSSSTSTANITTAMNTSNAVTSGQQSTTESASNQTNPGYTQMLFSMTLQTESCTDAIKNVSSAEYKSASQLFRTIISSIGNHLQISTIEIDRLSFTCGSVIGEGIMQLPRSTTETADQISSKFNGVIQDDLLPEIATYRVSGFDAADINECNSTDNFCHEFAVCTNGDPGYSCQCQIGYSDEDPLLPGSSCRDICLLSNEPYCQNNGSCLRAAASGRPTCNCTDGFSGSRCENPVLAETTSESTTTTTDTRVSSTSSNLSTESSAGTTAKQSTVISQTTTAPTTAQTSTAVPSTLIFTVPMETNTTTLLDSTVAVTTSRPTLNTTAFFVQPDTTPATSAISSTTAMPSASSATTATRLVEFSTLRSVISSTEETTTSESISSATSMHSTTNAEPHTSPIMVSASTKESSVPTSCSVKQSISGYTFPPTQPGLTTYSEEKCSNDENTALASIPCLIEDFYDTTSLKVSKCKSIDYVISAPLANTTLEDLDFATANVSALNENQVEQVVEYLNNISNLNAQYSQKEIMEATSIFSHISEYYNETKVTAVERPGERQNLVRSFEKISRHLDSGNTSSLSVFTPRVNVEVSDISEVDTPYVFNATFYEDKTSNVTSYPMTITIPAGALTQARSLLSSLRVVSVGYRSSVLFPSEITTDWVISSSLGNSTHSLEGIALSDPVIIRSNNIVEPPGQQIVDNKKVVTNYECVFWDFNIRNWSTEGCSLLSSEPATCQCNHLTNFAILVSRVELPADQALSIVTYIGVGLSILGLLLTLLIICLSRRLRKKYQMQILGNICLCLAIALTLFVSGVHYQVDTVHCSILTVFMHFFFLTTWTWTAVYSYTIYRDIAQVMASYGRRFKIQYAACFGYGAPLVIVILNAGITLGHIDRDVRGNTTLESSYRSRNFCWLRHYSLYFGFLLPVGLLLLFNIVVYCIVMPKITCKIAQIQSTKSKRSTTQNVVTSVCLATMMGLSWAFGYLMLVSEEPTFINAMSWLFTITNSFQGVIIFYLTAIRTGELRKLFAPLKTDLSVVSTGLSTTDDKS